MFYINNLKNKKDYLPSGTEKRTREIVESSGFTLSRLLVRFDSKHLKQKWNGKLNVWNLNPHYNPTTTRKVWLTFSKMSLVRFNGRHFKAHAPASQSHREEQQTWKYDFEIVKGIKRIIGIALNEHQGKSKSLKVLVEI